VAFPPLGCGNGGLSWEEVGPLMYGKLRELNIEIEVFAPYGTPKSQLGEDFLAGPAQMELGGRGRKQEKMNPEWVVVNRRSPGVGETTLRKSGWSHDLSKDLLRCNRNGR
jgi:hypothetical protein